MKTKNAYKEVNKLMDGKKRMQSCISFVNNAKAEIESVSEIVRSPQLRDELNKAYTSLNETINHCNMAMKNL
jgi:hypothetical protein